RHRECRYAGPRRRPALWTLQWLLRLDSLGDLWRCRAPGRGHGTLSLASAATVRGAPGPAGPSRDRGVRRTPASSIRPLSGTAPGWATTNLAPSRPWQIRQFRAVEFLVSS